MDRIRVFIVGGCLAAVVAVVPTHPGLAAPPVQAQSVAATSTLAVITTIGVGGGPRGVAVDEGDYTVYVTNFFSGTVSVINGRLGVLTDDTITVGSNPEGVAVDQGDDTVYVTNFFSGTVSVINGRLGVLTDDTITVGSNPEGVAVDQGDDTVYVTNQGGTVSVINGRRRQAGHDLHRDAHAATAINRVPVGVAPTN
jgi:YVTN family beta-propeller protein